MSGSAWAASSPSAARVAAARRWRKDRIGSITGRGVSYQTPPVEARPTKKPPPRRDLGGRPGAGVGGVTRYGSMNAADAAADGGTTSSRCRGLGGRRADEHLEVGVPAGQVLEDPHLAGD